MDPNMSRFNQRVNRIERSASARHSRNIRIRRDGLIEYRKPIWRPGIPWRSLALAAFCCLALKGFMIWHQGEAAYADRLAGLEADTTGGQIAARLLSMDPASTWIAAQLSNVIGAPPHRASAGASGQTAALEPAEAAQPAPLQ